MQQRNVKSSCLLQYSPARQCYVSNIKNCISAGYLRLLNKRLQGKTLEPPGSRISSLHRQSDHWQAVLLAEL
ncbi:hypothetical protein D3C75_1084460 [compost metagenome]